MPNGVINGRCNGGCSYARFPWGRFGCRFRRWCFGISENGFAILLLPGGTLLDVDALLGFIPGLLLDGRVTLGRRGSPHDHVLLLFARATTAAQRDAAVKKKAWDETK